MSSAECGRTFLVAFIFLLAPGCSFLDRREPDTEIVDARQLTLQGMDIARAGDWGAAEKLFEDAIKRNPLDERARCQFAQACWRRGDQQAAIEQMEEAVRLSGGDPVLLVDLGRMYIGAGQREAARQCAHKSLDVNRTSAAYALLGDAAVEDKDDTTALSFYHRSLALDPSNREVVTAVADLYLRLGRPQRSLATLAAIDKIDAGNTVPGNVSFLRGLAFKQMGRFGDAVKQLELAQHEQHPNVETLYHLSEARLLAGQPGNARLAILRALEIDPNHRAGIELARRIEYAEKSDRIIR